MPETRSRRSRASSSNGRPSEATQPTRRVVLKRERVLVLPDDVPDELLNAIGKLAKDAKRPISTVPEQAWRIVDEQEGTDIQAIRAYAGQPGTPDAKPGVYKAPPLRSWRGGEELVRPPQPKVESRRLVDE